MQSAEKQESSWGAGLRRVLVSGVVIGLAVLLIGLGQGYVFQIYPVVSRSMAPMLLPEDFVFVNRLAYSVRQP